jgi:hypothetical protein
MLSFSEFIQVAALVEKLHGRYKGSPANAVCDLLTLIARAAHLHGVPLASMLDAVRRGANVPKG